MIDLLQQSPPVAIAAATLMGLLIGSFLNVVIYRVPVMLEREWAAQAAEFANAGAETARAPATEPAAEPAVEPAATTAATTTGTPAPDQGAPFNLMVPRSRCPSCGHEITALENIPVISWLVLRGRCSSCATPISIRYPSIELATALLSGLAIWHLGATAAGLAALVLTWFLVSLTFIDFDTQLLPDNMTLPLLWLGLLLNLFGVFAPLHSAVIGAIAGYLTLWTIYWAFKLATGKEGMGYGDFKLLAALGAWFGWQALPGIILLSSVVGAVVGIGLMVLARRGREVPMPFGPYLAGAGLLTLYFGRPIAAYFGLA
ncbi:MAG: prepilin peptidase [Burkholderiaceae bacterium]|nr:prepilin peptidase [Burkholderiaceae bacterium]